MRPLPGDPSDPQGPVAWALRVDQFRQDLSGRMDNLKAELAAKQKEMLDSITPGELDQ